MIYTVTMNPALDLLLPVPELSEYAVTRAEREEVRFGGKGVNVSLALRALGVPSTAMGFAAGFTGEALVGFLETQGISARFLRLSEGFTRINVKLTGAADTEINAPGPAVQPEDVEAFLAGLDALRPGDTLVLSGSVPPGAGNDVYARAVRRAGERGARAAVDAAGKLFENAVREGVFLVKPNREELGALFGEKLESDAAVLEKMRALQARGAENVLTSLGGDGALLLTGAGEVYRAGAAKGTVRSTTAAGDSMLAGVLAALEKGKTFPEALELGTAAGGATAFSVGVAGFQKIMAVYETVKGTVRRVG